MSIRSHALASKSASAITPAGTAQPRRFNGIWVGGAGNVVVKFEAGGPNVTFSAVPAGTYLPISPWSVETGSTATLMVGL